MNNRKERMEKILRILEKTIEQDKKDKFDKEKLISQIMFNFNISRRIATEDINAAIIYLGW